MKDEVFWVCNIFLILCRKLGHALCEDVGWYKYFNNLIFSTNIVLDMTIKKKLILFVAIDILISTAVVVSVSWARYWISYSGWPLSFCDFKDRNFHYNNGQGVGGLKPRNECLALEVSSATNPDIRLCYKPGFNDLKYHPTECAIGAAVRTRRLDLCHRMFDISNDDFFGWECIGRVSRAIGDIDDSKCKNAPTKESQDMCKTYWRGEEYSHMIIPY